MKRGRRSVQELLTAPKASVLDRVPRPTVPPELTDEETEIWAAVVGAMPADYFGAETMPILSQYCRHVIQARRIAELIEQATSDPSLRIRDYDRLLKLLGRESAMIAALSTKMRISHQSTRTHRGNRRSGNQAGPRPWE